MSEFVQLYSRLRHPDLNVEITVGQGIDYLLAYLDKPQLHPDLHPDMEHKRRTALVIMRALEAAIRKGIEEA